MIAAGDVMTERLRASGLENDLTLVKCWVANLRAGTLKQLIIRLLYA